MSFLKKSEILKTVAKDSKASKKVSKKESKSNKKESNESRYDFDIDKVTKTVLKNLKFKEIDVHSYEAVKNGPEVSYSLVHIGEINDDESKYVQLKVNSEENFTIYPLIYSKKFDTFANFTKDLNKAYKNREDYGSRDKASWEKIILNNDKSFKDIENFCDYMKNIKMSEENAIELVEKTGERYLELNHNSFGEKAKKKADYGEAIVSMKEMAKGYKYKDVYFALFAIYTKGSNNVELHGVGDDKIAYSYKSSSNSKIRDRNIRNFIATAFFKNFMDDYYKFGGSKFKVSNFVR